jgi:uncharacterized protein (DUF2141 family)
MRKFSLICQFGAQSCVEPKKERASRGQVARVFPIVAIVIAASAALADSAPPPDDLARLSDPTSVVLAVRTAFPAEGGDVRLAVYADETNFLERALVNGEAKVGADGLAVMKLEELAAGVYAFAAYYDANGDGRLNRGGVLGKPKEPFGFSNGVRPKLRKPKFEEAAVQVAPGAVIALTIED